MNITALNTAFKNLTDWVRTSVSKKANTTDVTTALNLKQNNVIVKTADPVPADGVNGDICVVVDP